MFKYAPQHIGYVVEFASQMKYTILWD